MADPSVYNDHRKAAETGRRLKELEGPKRLADAWRQASADLEAARSDPELAGMAALEEVSEVRLAGAPRGHIENYQQDKRHLRGTKEAGPEARASGRQYRGDPPRRHACDGQDAAADAGTADLCGQQPQAAPADHDSRRHRRCEYHRQGDDVVDRYHGEHDGHARWDHRGRRDVHRNDPDEPPVQQFDDDLGHWRHEDE